MLGSFDLNRGKQRRTLAIHLVYIDFVFGSCLYNAWKLCFDAAVVLTAA